MAARVDESWAVAFVYFRACHDVAAGPGGLHLDRIDDHGAVFIAQSQKIAAFAGFGKAQPQARETGIDGHEERLGVALLVVAGGDQHAGEAEDPGGVGQTVGAEEIDQPIAQQNDAFLEKLLQFLRSEAEVELVQWRPQEERQAFVARIVADRAPPPVTSFEDPGNTCASGRRKRPVGEEEPERARVGVGQDGLDVFAHLVGVGRRLRSLTGLGVQFPLHVVEGPEHRLLQGRQEVDLAADRLVVDPPAHSERTHGQQIDAARLLAHAGGGLVEHGEHVDGLVVEAVEAIL